MTSARALAIQDVIEAARRAVATHEALIRVENQSKKKQTAPVTAIWDAEIDHFAAMSELRSAIHGLDLADPKGGR